MIPKDKTGQTFKTLEEFTAAFSTFCDALTDEVLILDRQFKVVFANKALLQNKGWTAEEVVGRHCYQVSHQRTEPCASPEDVCPMLETLASGSSARATHIHRDKQGNRSYVDVVTSPVKNPNGEVIGVVELIRDITKMVELEKALSQRNEDLSTLNDIIMMGNEGLPENEILRRALRKILENTKMDAGWIMLKDEQTGMLRCLDSVGVSRRFIDTIVTLPPEQTLCGQAVVTGRVAILENFSEDPSVTHPTLKAEGLRAFMCAPLRSNSKILGSISVAGRTPSAPPATQLTQLVAIGDQLGLIVANSRMRQSLQRYVNELEEARRRRDEFASAISHELKQVLSVLSGYAQLLRMWQGRELATKDFDKIVDTINSQSKRLNRLIDDMRDVSSLEAGRFVVVPELCELVAIARDILQARQSLTQIHRLVLDSTEPRIVGRWDCDRIRQVLDNLVDNAIKYSPKGGEVRVRISRQEQEVFIAVSDQGVGIARKELPHLFRPYARAQKEIKGLGLGLFICKGIVEAHGGRIWVESQEGKGSTFYVSLPTKLSTQSA